MAAERAPRGPAHLRQRDMPAASLITTTVEEFQAMSGLSKTATYELIKAGSIRSVKIMKRRLIIIDSYREFLASLEASDAR